MFIPFILSIITILLISSFSSLYSLKINQYINFFKPVKEKQFIFQEKIVIEAVDSYCRKNFTECRTQTEATSEMFFTLAQLQPFSPELVNLNFATTPYSEIKLNTTTKKITIFHKINDLNIRTTYSNYYLQKNQNLICKGGDVAPCSGLFIGKEKTYSEELQILFLEDKIAVLTAKLLLPEEYPGQYNDILLEINTLQAEITALQTIIDSRKLRGF